MGEMRALVCGGRDFADKTRLWLALDNLCCDIDEGEWFAPHVTIIHGGAKGADLLADAWAVASYAQIAHFPADWEKHGKAAGPIRNQRMIDEGRPDVVVAFPGGRGTADMIRRAEAAGIRVVKA